MSAASELWSALENEFRQLQDPELFLRVTSHAGDPRNGGKGTWLVCGDGRKAHDHAALDRYKGLVKAYCERAWKLSGSPAIGGADEGGSRFLNWWLNLLERESPHRKAVTVSATYVSDARYDEFQAASPEERLHERFEVIRADVSKLENGGYEPFLNRISYNNVESPWFEDITRASVDYCELRKAKLQAEEVDTEAVPAAEITEQEIRAYFEPKWQAAGFKYPSHWADAATVPRSVLTTYLKRQNKNGISPKHREALADAIHHDRSTMPR